MEQVTREPQGAWKRTHPTVSFRVSLEDRKRLEKMVFESGLSMAEMLRRGLGLLEPLVANLRARWNQGWMNGYAEGKEEGFKEAMARFYPPCGICGSPLELDPTDPEVQAAIRSAFRTWGHASHR
jgi:hypothetical protein